MAYNPVTAAANKAAAAAKDSAVATVQDLTDALLGALRLANQAEPPPVMELVTIGITSDPKLDRQIFCQDCLGRDGPAWNPHKWYYMANDPTRPGQVVKVENIHAHPRVPKTISYDVISARQSLEGGPPKQCLQCGHDIQLS